MFLKKTRISRKLGEGLNKFEKVFKNFFIILKLFYKLLKFYNGELIEMDHKHVEASWLLGLAYTGLISSST